MRIGSLFSGIGGLELGLEWAGLGHTVWQVESDARCREVLARHWPDATRWDDVRTVGNSNLDPVDLVCGGFPCQDVSSAGKRAGLAGARSGLWFEYLRIVGELRPSWVVVENVASGARAWVDVVVDGLGEQGYACFPIPLAAADVGAPHERKRIFIVAAHADAKSQHASAFDAEVAGTPTLAADAVEHPLRIEQGRCSGAHGRRASEPTDDSVTASTDAVQARQSRGQSGGSIPQIAFVPGCGWRAPQPDMVRVVHGFSARVDRARARIESLGNAVVPQCAEVIGHVIREIVVG